MLANAAVLYEINKPLVVEDVEVLEPGAHEVRVKWAANGVCHSDLHVMTGDYPHPLPVVSRRLPLSELNHAFDLMKQGEVVKRTIIVYE